ncbi:4Fe-4S dicluster domain-containing protein [Peptoniphilus genitalis]|uniref:4Fe-4S dicluster domain-containing protein n=1 Tax=Peptoniphilus genitalis TaxID=3036303 RepID=UPI0024AD04A2|nr:4Fe-4S dicluster domain-containing protein [Peptoniphilus sp. Marseille-Q7072]MDU6030857.1 4Fe-4S dicluster domain-containing protein [Peptoniphilus harei]
MKEIYGTLVDIRRKVFAEVARIAYNDLDISALEESSYKIVPGEVARYRSDIFRERAVVDERLRLAMGLDVREIGVFKNVTDGFDKVDIDTNAYEKPLINVIKFGCEACPTKAYYTTDNCRKCLAHPCINVCPVNAISMGKDRTIIDKDKCVRCGRCHDACPYSAIVKYERPCAAACGVDAISSDEFGRAEIDHDKCVACGRCIAECPFGAISDKTQIFQLIKAIKSGKRVYGAIAPSYIGQFGANVSAEQIIEAIKQLGFEDVLEVALGADLTTLHEAKEYLERVPEEIPFMGTSCCFSWTLMIKNEFPEFFEQVSDSGSPMRYTANHIKAQDPDAVVVFIGPCTSKKLEAIDTKVKSDVDFVITFEELMGMFVAKNIEPSEIQVEEVVDDGSALGRGYPIAGGVAESVKVVAEKLAPEKDIHIQGAHTLAECKKMLKIAKAGKLNGYLLEGMACPGGCVAGVGTIASVNRVKKQIEKFKKDSAYPTPLENVHIEKERESI